MAAIDVKTQLVIEQVRLDAKAQADLAAIKAKFMASPAGSLPGASADFDAAAKRQGLDRGARAQPGTLDKLQMANPATIAMKALTSVIETGIKNSKIVQTITKKVGEALGLLVDLILLPFLPILIWALIGLFKAVLWLGDMWKKFVTPIIEWVGDLYDDIIGWLGLDKEKNFYSDIFEWLGLKKKKELEPDDMPSKKDKLLDTIDDSTWQESLKKKFLGLGFLVIENLGGGIVERLYSVWNPALQEALAELQKWWTGFTSFEWLGDPLKVAKEWFAGFASGEWIGEGAFWEVIKSWFRGFITFDWLPEPFKIIKNFAIGFFSFGWLSDPFKPIRDKFTDFMSFKWLNVDTAASVIKSFIRQSLPYGIGDFLGFEQGGTVPGVIGKPQLAVVHGGETITPPGKQIGSISNAFNFYGLTNDQLVDKIRGVQRLDATRYSQ